MDYQFENLGDERFQELCGSIIASLFPNVQAYPVGQPDGGRDAIVYEFEGATNRKNFIVFQVKFSRDGNKERDVAKWLKDTLVSERPKFEKLVARGATSYYLLTNIRGTAHLDSGSKDIVTTVLESTLSMPAICWWRDDLCRIIEKDINLKWSFPEILSGQDALNSLIFDHFSDSREKRSAALRAYLTDQFLMESEVKFKQIDLHNKLLALFTDVPLRIKKIGEKNKRLRKALGEIFKQPFADDPHSARADDNQVGGVEFILHNTTQHQITKILIEGGPGQGKSTITQYVCQVHRIKLLGIQEDVKLLPESVFNAPVRVPFKIDLRDVASWAERKNPYQNILPDEYFNKNWANSLEAYLLGHIYYHSKVELTIADVLAIFKNSPILFVFDGFDEIADLDLRRSVIEFINKGVARLSANAKSIQVVITSRPAAFSDAVVFSVDDYPHFELADITPKIINEYVGKWIKASKIDSRDAAELKRLVSEKLQLPHLKDLTKSPMQLAIFISLLRTKGQSLPNKRTALFDSYINLFFDRESEKSMLIRDKRDLITDIHHYLAWVLHSEAERYKNSGRISLPDLHEKLRDYLLSEGHDPSITEKLFSVIEERVCALVSRVQGTFEFEVQPLREYFCAKYLYTTAQNSTAGNIRRGTKPDRFRAMLRNPYWQNVVRFFAGCADVGELDMIIQELKDLQEDSQYKYTHYPRILTSQILSDYVFTQKPKKLTEAVKIIIDGINIGNIINETNHSANSERIMLPDECGRVEVVTECFRQLATLPRRDYAAELIGIITNNPINNLERWLEFFPRLKEADEVSTWFEYAYRLQLMHKLDDGLIRSVLESATEENLDRRLRVVLDAKRERVLTETPEIKLSAVSALASNRLSAFPRGNPTSALGFLALMLNPYILRLAHHSPPQPLIFSQYLAELWGRNNDVNYSQFEAHDDIDRKIECFKNDIRSFSDGRLDDLKYSLDIWTTLVDAAVSHFGESWNCKVISSVAAAVKVKPDESRKILDLADQSASLCSRARTARLRSGNVAYWRDVLSNSTETKYALLLFFSWATSRTIHELLNLACEKISKLDSHAQSELIDGVTICAELSMLSETQQRQITEAIQSCRSAPGVEVAAYITSLRFKNRDGDKFLRSFFKDLETAPDYVMRSQFNYLTREFLRTPSSEKTLGEIKRLYAASAAQDDQYYYMAYLGRAARMPPAMAKRVMTNCKDYPRAVASLAEMTCRAIANSNLVPIGEIAETEGWFETS